LSSVAWLRLLLIFTLGVAHISFWIWLFNRVNSLALERKAIKRLEKSVVLLCLTLPFFLFLIEWRYGTWGRSWQQLWDHFQEPDFYRRGSIGTLVYFGVVLAFLAWIGPQWLAHRPIFAIAKNRYRTLHQGFERNLHRRNPTWVTGSMTRACLAIPGNEIMDLETNVKRIYLDNLNAAFVGMRIGHFSDIHLMGQIAPEFTRYCVDWMIAHGAELLVLSGDLVDDPKAIPHLETALGGLPSDIPKYFVLGNHERAHGLVDAARDSMVALGWLDAGAQDWQNPTKRGVVQVFGNERPWLDRHRAVDSGGPGVDRRRGLLLGIAHSPDQFSWARSVGCHVLLCGHNHGGQIRVPAIGPIVSPSRYGSRYASGIFFRSPTLMHVSRGVSGTHPWRWRCSPEASLLELAQAPSGRDDLR